MRVLLVHNFYQIPGGEDSVVRDEYAMLRANGVDVDLFSVHNDAIDGPLKSVAAAAQVIYRPSAKRALARKLAEYAPDIVHVHNFFPLLSPSIFDACKNADVPVVLTLHNFRIMCPGALLYPDEALREYSLRNPCWWTVKKKVYRQSAAATLAVALMVEFHKRTGTWTSKVDQFIALTDWAKEKFVEGGLPRKRIVVKPTAVARQNPISRCERAGGLFVGRLDEQKGVRTLISAWKSLDYPLKIIGDGPLSGLLEESPNPRITYLGRQPREVVRQEMMRAKFLIVPSTGHEMFPVTVVEAFSSNLPVIASNLESLSGLIRPGLTGLIFPPGDAEALAKQVHWAMTNDHDLQDIGRRASETYEALYTPEANYAQLRSVYEALC